MEEFFVSTMMEMTGGGGTRLERRNRGGGGGPFLEEQWLAFLGRGRVVERLLIVSETEARLEI